MNHISITIILLFLISICSCQYLYWGRVYWTEETCTGDQWKIAYQPLDICLRPASDSVEHYYGSCDGTTLTVYDCNDDDCISCTVEYEVTLNQCDSPFTTQCFTEVPTLDPDLFTVYSNTTLYSGETCETISSFVLFGGGNCSNSTGLWRLTQCDEDRILEFECSDSTCTNCDLLREYELDVCIEEFGSSREVACQGYGISAAENPQITALLILAFILTVLSL